MNGKALYYKPHCFASYRAELAIRKKKIAEQQRFASVEVIQMWQPVLLDHSQKREEYP